MLSNGKKIHLMRDAFARLAVEQPAHNTIKTWALEANDLPSVALLDLFNNIEAHPKRHSKAMSLEEFRETARFVLEADLERIEYLQGACQIDLVIRGPECAQGMFCLTIANSSEQGFDLAAFESQLYDWAASEGHFDEKEG